MGTCPECEEHVELGEEADVGDVIECPRCKTRLEILDLFPVTFDYASDPDAEHG